MNAQVLLAKVEALGVVLKADGDQLLYRPQEAVSPQLMAELRAHKAELLELLSWPAESCDPDHWHGGLAERLWPFVGKTVRTPQGCGRLVTALPERAVVILRRRPRHLAVFLPCEIRPPGPSGKNRGARQGPH